MVGIASNCLYSSISEIKLQLAKLLLSILAQALHSQGQRKLLPAARLIVRKHRRRRFEKGVATCTQVGLIVALISETCFHSRTNLYRLGAVRWQEFLGDK